MKRCNRLLYIFLFTITAPEAIATNYYVSSLIGSDGFSGSFTQPFATMQRAANLTNPGDTVFVMNGTYATSPNNHDILKITRSGTASMPIVYKNFAGHIPFIDFKVWYGILVSDGAAYIVIDGFKIRGNNRNITLSDAINQPSGCANTAGSPNPIYNGGGISVDGRDAGHCHHITIRNTEIYECGGGGVGAIESDYITVENNLIYNNSWYTKYGGSGISFLHSWNYDNDTGIFKMIIRNNIVYGNQLFVPWRNGTVCEGITDGNGIIYDDNRNTQLGPTGIPYVGKALIENNVSYRNGGRGIHNYLSDNTTIRNNTTFQNCKSEEIPDGEITVYRGANVQVYNNIMYARTGKRASSATEVPNFLEDNNIMYNSPLKGFYNSNDILANPQFVDTANNDFRLSATSPAINVGSNRPGTFSQSDILEISRPMGSLPDIGAYEFTGIPASVNFDRGTIAALRVGDGAGVLGTDAAAVSILEYTTTGTPTGFNIVLGDASAQAPNRIILSGSNNTAEGQLSLSTDGRYLSVAGYEGAVGTASSVYQANDKVIARVAYNGTADFTTRIAGTAINRTVRSAITDNSNRFYIAGSSAAPASGNSTRFVTFGSPVSTASIAFSGAMRSIKIFKGQVYYANNNTVGSLTPNPAAGNFATNTPFPGVAISGHNYQSLVLLDQDVSASYNNTGYDVLYCSDLNLGIVKFYWNGSTWILAGTYNPSSATGVTGGLQDLAARLNSSGNPEIYAVKGAAANNNIIALTDAGGISGNISITLPNSVNIASAGNGYMFRGIAFTPSPLVTLATDLFSFKGYLTADKVLLKWAVSTSVNIKEFIIEKSIDGSTFSSIGTIGSANNANTNHYEFADGNTKMEKIFYRLKTVDNDGSVSYSAVVLIKLGINTAGKLSLFPNPVALYATVSYPEAAEKASLSIFHSDGKKIGDYNIAKGSVQRSIDISGLSRGQYFIIYRNKNKTLTYSFLK